MYQPTLDHFRSKLAEFGIPENQIVEAWHCDSSTKAATAVRFSNNHVFSLTELKAIFCIALKTPADEGWQGVFNAWKRRAT